MTIVIHFSLLYNVNFTWRKNMSLEKCILPLLIYYPLISFSQSIKN